MIHSIRERYFRNDGCVWMGEREIKNLEDGAGRSCCSVGLDFQGRGFVPAAFSQAILSAGEANLRARSAHLRRPAT